MRVKVLGQLKVEDAASLCSGGDDWHSLSAHVAPPAPDGRLLRRRVGARVNPRANWYCRRGPFSRERPIPKNGMPPDYWSGAPRRLFLSRGCVNMSLPGYRRDWNAVVDWMGNGLWDLTWWQMRARTPSSPRTSPSRRVTIFLHRCTGAQGAGVARPSPRISSVSGSGWARARRPRNGWPSTASTTPSAKPPQTRTARRPVAWIAVMWRGAELYRAEAKNAETLQKFGHGTPDDWMERNIYRRFWLAGVAPDADFECGLVRRCRPAVWAVQMVWIPFWAAGIVKAWATLGLPQLRGARRQHQSLALGHPYRRGRVAQQPPHLPTAAKFSVKPFEFDIGWLYISLMQKVGWASGEEGTAQAASSVPPSLWPIEKRWKP